MTKSQREQAQCVSVSPVAMAVGLVSSGECWLLAYNVWLGVLTYSLFDFPMWKWFLLCHDTHPVPSLSGMFLVASVLAGMSVCPPSLSIWR